MVTKKYDDDTLIAGLEKLTGNDFNACEMAERRAGNHQPDLAFSKAFQARLAARALKEDLGGSAGAAQDGDGGTERP